MFDGLDDNSMSFPVKVSCWNTLIFILCQRESLKDIPPPPAPRKRQRADSTGGPGRGGLFALLKCGRRENTG